MKSDSSTKNITHADIAFIGGGHMAAALIGGLRNAAPDKIIVVADRNADKRKHLQAQYNIVTVASAKDLPPADILVLAVRPADMQAACLSLPISNAAEKTESNESHFPTIVSVALGISINAICRWLPFTPLNIARAMPNTPAAIGCGMTACYGTLSSPAKKQISFLFESCGKAIWLPEEKLLDAATAVSGSGPAYFYYIAEAMNEAALAMGLPADIAATLIAQTMEGGARMLMEGEQTATDLRRAVAVPGGSTESAINVMQKQNLKNIFIEAMQACQERARETGNMHSDSDNDKK